MQMNQISMMRSDRFLCYSGGVCDLLSQITIEHRLSRPEQKESGKDIAQ